MRLELIGIVGFSESGKPSKAIPKLHRTRRSVQFSRTDGTTRGAARLGSGHQENGYEGKRAL